MKWAKTGHPAPRMLACSPGVLLYSKAHNSLVPAGKLLPRKNRKYRGLEDGEVDDDDCVRVCYPARSLNYPLIKLKARLISIQCFISRCNQRSYAFLTHCMRSGPPISNSFCIVGQSSAVH